MDQKSHHQLWIQKGCDSLGPVFLRRLLVGRKVDGFGMPETFPALHRENFPTAETTAYPTPLFQSMFLKLALKIDKRWNFLFWDWAYFQGRTFWFLGRISLSRSIQIDMCHAQNLHIFMFSFSTFGFGQDAVGLFGTSQGCAPSNGRRESWGGVFRVVVEKNSGERPWNRWLRL